MNHVVLLTICPCSTACPTWTLGHTYTHFLFLSLALSFFLPLSHTHTHTLSLPPPLSPSLFLSLSIYLSLTHPPSLPPSSSLLLPLPFFCSVSDVNCGADTCRTPHEPARVCSLGAAAHSQMLPRFVAGRWEMCGARRCFAGTYSRESAHTSMYCRKRTQEQTFEKSCELQTSAQHFARRAEFLKRQLSYIV